MIKILMDGNAASERACAYFVVTPDKSNYASATSPVVSPAELLMLLA